MNSFVVLGIMFILFLGLFTLFGKFAARLRGVEPKKNSKK